MGYAFGQNNNGREIGYGVTATCDLEGCEEKIDRGMAYCCGGGEGIQNAGMEDEPYCGGFFCAKHLNYGVHGFDEAVCPDCLEQLQCQDCDGAGHDGDGDPCDTCDSYGAVFIREPVA